MKKIEIIYDESGAIIGAGPEGSVAAQGTKMVIEAESLRDIFGDVHPGAHKVEGGKIRVDSAKHAEMQKPHHDHAGEVRARKEKEDREKRKKELRAAAPGRLKAMESAEFNALSIDKRLELLFLATRQFLRENGPASTTTGDQPDNGKEK